MDVRLSEKRDMAAAKAFFKQAHEVADVPPERVFTDGHRSYPRAIEEEWGTEVEHAVIPCLGNPIEQSHRGIKQRYYPTLGVGVVESAQLRSINSSAPVSAWRNSCLYRIGETTF